MISVCIKLSRNFEILDLLREQVFSKNLEESRRTGNNSYQLSEYIRTSHFEPHLLALYFCGEPTLAVPNVIFFCAWVSHVMLTRFRKCVLHPTLM